MWQQKWVVGNWKMNGSVQKSRELCESLRRLPDHEKVWVGIAPPLPYLVQALSLLPQDDAQAVQVCAQDVSRFAGNGAYTGEVSAEMLKDIGIGMSLVGHSERSLYFDETAKERRQKLENLLACGLIPLLCVGESLDEREAGRQEEVVAGQLSVLAGLNAGQFAVAYEPVWAIGTGKVATAEQITAMHRFIYEQILSLHGNSAKIRVLYGGSVNAKNAAEIFQAPYVDGALVGGASLAYDSFAAIIEAAQQA